MYILCFLLQMSILFLLHDAMLARYYGRVSVCLSVYLCLCLSQVGVLSKRRNVYQKNTRQNRSEIVCMYCVLSRQLIFNEHLY